MKVIFTKHAGEKLRRSDIKKFKISKRKINQILKDPRSKSKTKYGNFAALEELDLNHDIRYK
ncbi:MAG: hypothetical protein US53_C0030G0005 [Candidatus Woesebacteria bacterium GW2011_GWA1_37_7]|uniref:Uncharacterized protein n=1 Tax=Candidatus Woesebacteria bacterium GW2011_GWA1_37_7 TaxID=1618545 RepID=A0A0G0H186_9BACT|nr:MAG: hypothetical protein US53_C0030G0005 [Candidatus Woesebacteria bacterium GW2011_GWA1_37_7]